jgi:hypothetical protein
MVMTHPTYINCSKCSRRDWYVEMTVQPDGSVQCQTCCPKQERLAPHDPGYDVMKHPDHPGYAEAVAHYYRTQGAPELPSLPTPEELEATIARAVEAALAARS